MFLLVRPSAARIAGFLGAQEGVPFSYAEVGGTRGAPPAGYTVDHNRVRLGSGAETFERAVNALHRWSMLDLGWATVQPAGTVVEPGLAVAVVAAHYGFWSVNACRVVYMIDELEPVNGVRRAGFAYGTLPDHGAAGEERFTAEWHAPDDSVWYDLYAISRPRHLLARLGYPLARRLQRRFALASKAAMVAAANLDVVHRR